jgi:hypothetical protein
MREASPGELMRLCAEPAAIIWAVTRALFPHQRDDGSFTVAARFAVSGADTTESVRRRLAAWVSARNADWPDGLLGDFFSPPEIHQAGPDTLDVVFEGRPGSRMWKGWMVDLTRELRSVEGTAFAGFWDLVTGRSHPASVRPPASR